MANGITDRDGGPGQTGDGLVLILGQQGDSTAQKKLHESAVVARADDQIGDLKKELLYFRRQVHGLRSKLHGELAVLALRVEDNDQRSMRRRVVMRRWAVAVILAAWLWQMPASVAGMMNGSVLLPGLLSVSMTIAAGIAIVLLRLHNQADEEHHRDRYRNWFRLTVADDAYSDSGLRTSSSQSERTS
jgi:hypothetical protein